MFWTGTNKKGQAMDSFLRILLLCFVVVNFSMKDAHSQEKIAGAFSINLGDDFEPSKAIGKGVLTDGTPMYQFAPQKKFRSFSRYFVLITPKTHKVYSIWGIGNIENSPTCEKEQKLLMAILQKKYGKQQKKDLFSSLYDAEMINQGERYISTKCTGFSNVTIDIRYKDQKLEKLAENERIELESEKLDSSGL